VQDIKWGSSLIEKLLLNVFNLDIELINCKEKWTLCPTKADHTNNNSITA